MKKPRNGSAFPEQVTKLEGKLKELQELRQRAADAHDAAQLQILETTAQLRLLKELESNG